MAAALPIVGAVGALAGGGAQLAQAAKPETDFSKPEMARANLQINPIPTANVQSDLNFSPLTQSVSSGAMPGMIHNFGTSRDMNLMHLLSTLSSGGN